MLITSGYNVEGYQIDAYLGYITGESALGTGFLSTFGAGVADALGRNSGMYSDKLISAKEIAMDEMQKDAERLKANAIIGMQISYVVFSADIVGVIASGTAVHISKCFAGTELDVTSIVNIPVINYYKDYFVPYNVKYDLVQQHLQVEMDLKSGKKLQAINVDIIMKTIFGTKYICKDINFTENSGEDTNYISEFVPVEISQNQMKIVQSAIVQVNYCLMENECITLGENYCVSEMDVKELVKLRRKNGNGVVSDFEELQSEWLCLCGETNTLEKNKCSHCGRQRGVYGIQGCNEVIAKLEEFDCVKDVYNFYAEDTDLPKATADILKKYSEFERLYGNMKTECMQELRENDLLK